MMLYAVVTEDIPGSRDKRAAARDAHVKCMTELQAAGRLIISGPCPAIDSPDPGPAGFTGSVIIAEFDSLDAANEWIAADPYVASGVFAKVTVKPFRKGFPR
jgi:uncharacterized protein YciI